MAEETKRMGRPFKFNDPKELQEKIFGKDGYFETADREERPYTVSSLAYFLDTTRETLLRAEKDYKDISDSKKEIQEIITKAKQRIMAYAEESLLVGKNQIGCIFSLKANWGFKDTQEIKLTETAPRGLAAFLSIAKDKEEDEEI